MEDKDKEKRSRSSLMEIIEENGRAGKTLTAAVAAAGIAVACLMAFLLVSQPGQNTAPAGEAAPAGTVQKEAAASGDRQSVSFPEVQAGQAAVFLADACRQISCPVIEDASDPYRDKPQIDPDDWMFILANPWNDISDYEPALGTLEGQQFDERIIEPMRDFAQAARDEGLSVVLSSGYRSYATQTYLFNRKVSQYGEEVAATIVARPGTSEHQTGLCCDITDRYYEMKDESLEDTALYQWMSEHCQEYGFIVRFPKGREDVTGIIYEPWHFRYVGKEAASYIMEHDLTLEEFLALYEE